MVRLTCGDYAHVLSHSAHEAMGAARHPAFPAPSFFEGGRNDSGISCRETAFACCLISERFRENSRMSSGMSSLTLRER